ncbi:TPA: tyrosine-type recombinase/integrase [Methanosarcina acetivorans]|uniref:Integrase n=2 Tax=Methanosarcina acetivorans TaxID=2214 RepID=Q8TJJ0_METAC|nr:site-specific integrase [Methanosarcina acetivorans]AAM07145.1 integrase [Methanosarcina acetivorans C2A]HIH92803.1 tyrosine-type recombinase/integrase [Methanosarcina acetivorans]
MSIHEYYTDIWLPKLEEKIRTADYPKRNRDLILKFETYLFSEGLKSLRVLKYLFVLDKIASGSSVSFSKMNEHHVQKIIADFERSELAASTKRDYKVIIRRFFKWLKGDKSPAAWIKVSKKVSDQKLPEYMITEDEVKRMIEAASNARDKAIIALLYDSGCRIGELGGVKIKNITFDQYGAVVVVSGKTGARRVRVTFAASYLAAWLDVHPYKEKSEAFVFINLEGVKKGEQMQYQAFQYTLKKIAKAAGIEKRIHLHLFRHSRSTELAQYLTEAQMEEHLGWAQGSEMPRTYVHLSGKQIDDAILGIYGKKKKEDTMPKLTSRICTRCKKENGPTSSFCAQCGLPLDPQAVQEVQVREDAMAQILEQLMKNKELRDLWNVAAEGKSSES